MDVFKKYVKYKNVKFWLLLIGVIAFGVSINEVIRAQVRGEGYPNNYLIFENVYFHFKGLKNLYLEYPEIYRDSNHYGPFFALFIAPFAMLPTFLGSVLWNIFSHLSLVFAVWTLPFDNKKKALIILIPIHVYIVSMMHSQSNPLIAAWLIFAFVAIKKGKDHWGTLFILLGFFVKIYGIVGLSFFLFSKNKWKFIGYTVIWSVVLFFAPTLIGSYDFLLQSYQDWWVSLTAKNTANLLSGMQNISMLGVLYKWSRDTTLSAMWVLVPAILLYLSSIMNFKNWHNTKWQYLLLASNLLFIVLFSTGSENVTYIIGVTGVSIWYILKKKRGVFHKILLGLVIIISTFSYSDLFIQSWHDDFIEPYAIVALPCFVVWLVVIWDMIFLAENRQITQ